MDRPEITYPCTWTYRVIGSDGELMLREIPKRLIKFKFVITPGNRSRRGKYVSINVDAMVRDEAERNSIVGLLQDIPTVRMVI